MLSVRHSPLLLLCVCWLLVMLVVNTHISKEINAVFITCHRNSHLQRLRLSVVLRMSCFETLVDCSKAEEVILGTFVTGKNLLLQFSLAHKSSLLPSGEGSVKAKNCGLTDTAAATATVAVTPAKNGNPKLYNFNPESCHNSQTSRGYEFNPWKTVFSIALLQSFFVITAFNVRLIFGIQSVQIISSRPWC